MNFPDLIERAKKACPGWEVPDCLDFPRTSLDEASCSIWLGVEMVSPPLAAALILASIKEWTKRQGIGWWAQSPEDSQNHSVSVSKGNDSAQSFAPTELEALIAALEAAQPKE